MIMEPREDRTALGSLLYAERPVRVARHWAVKARASAYRWNRISLFDPDNENVAIMKDQVVIRQGIIGEYCA